MDRRNFCKGCAYSMGLLLTNQIAMAGDGDQRGGHENGCRKFRDNNNDGNCDNHETCRDRCNRKPLNVDCDKFKDENKDYYCDLSAECTNAECHRRKSAQYSSSPRGPIKR